jgi:hypothetical protein
MVPSLPTKQQKQTLDKASQRITRQLPGVDFEFPVSSPFLRQTLELFRDPSKLRFTSSRQSLNKYVAYLTRILDYRFGSDKEQEQIFEKVFWPKNVLQRTLWSLQDLRDGGGLGFTDIYR